jgi:hypothetical protein
MKKLLCIVALATISSGSVFAYGNPVVKSAAMQMQSDTTKKMKKKSGKMKSKKSSKKDTTMTTPTTPGK